EAIVSADALVIATDWPQYAKADLNNLKSFMNRPLVFDGRNLFDPIEMSTAGIEYYSVGRKHIPPKAKLIVKPSQE
ncbi:UDP binding domain-containing protein, partial [Klebsiella pneumoniae]|uniref:UDP binding domain-containing protein n=1 Tax=Klebsiella pneumoniae TaxID=573 RepID=UPI003852FA94